MTRTSSTRVDQGNRKKTPLNRTDLDRFREILVENREAILADLRILHESLRSAHAAEQGSGSWNLDFAGSAADTEALEHAALQIRRLTAELEQLTTALGRMELGTYGVCVRCGSVIEKERLEALPCTRRCMSCKTAAEAA